MTRNEDVLSAVHMLAIGIIVVLSLSIITYPIGFLASADIGPSNTGTGSLASATSNDTELNNVADEGAGIPDATTILQPGVDSSSNAVPSSDSATDSSSSTSTSEPSDSSGEDVTATSDSLSSTPAANTGIIENDSATTEIREGLSTAGNTDVVENQSSSVSDSGEGSPAADIGVSDLSSGSPMKLQTPEANSLSTSASTESVTAASAENPNAVVQPISTGDGQTVSLGDVSNSEGTSAKISVDKKSYAPGDTAQVTLQDPDANLDPNVVNTVVIVVGSSISDPNGTPITLTEDAPDSGKFVGTTVVPGTGNSLKLNYDSSRPQAQVVMDGVSQGGAVEVKELPVSSFQSSLGEGQPDVLIGNGVEVSLIEGAELASNTVCENNGLLPPCGGSTNVIISYANAPLNNQQPSNFTIWQHVPGVGWVDLKENETCQPNDPIFCKIDVNENTKTITADSPFGPGVFVIGVNTGGGGGGGGGAGLAGAGLVLDFIAPIVASSEPPASEPPTTTPEPTTSLPDALISNVGADTTSSSLSTAGSDNNANISATKESGNTGVVSQEIGRATISNTGNTTIQVPGAGSVIVSFAKLSDGTLSVSAVKTPSELAALKIAKSGSEQSTLMTLDNTPYSLAGTVFVIGPTDSEFKGTAMVTIPYNVTLAPQASEVRMLQYTGSGWEDVTSKPPADGKVVTGSLSTLGAVAPAVKSQ